MYMRSLIELIDAIKDELAAPLPSPATTAITTITAITTDSRKVAAGYLFVALKGTKVDGTQFIAHAVQEGAVAVLCDVDVVVPAGAMALRAHNVRRALALLAASFYASQPAHMVAVTGTDGKTSTADFFRQLMHGLGKKAASIGTLGVFAGDGAELYPGANTTPDPISLQEMLANMASSGIDHACMEASSHGLHQHRLDGVVLEAAAFTNFARDHMDYHKTEEEYFAAKARLFELLPRNRVAVLNQDDARYGVLKALCEARGQKMLGFGRSGGQLAILDAQPLAHGQRVSLEVLGRRHACDLPLMGGFQVMNILAALGLVHGVGGDVEKALGLLPTLRGVAGRLELVATLGNGASVLVDYAHTPMALASILQVLRPHTHNKLHVVFGCGGDRDAGKRPLMGKVASELADVAIVTDDNPRSEDAALIRKAVLEGCVGGKEIADRKKAIYAAVEGLAAGDVLVIAGKGHEKYQIVGNTTHPFDDAVIARQAAKERAA
jgi:UDP-N-acetylmuramoyl-L-alanyl-D-glutamate--2,6-diaminopimelate ligase